MECPLIFEISENSSNSSVGFAAKTCRTRIVTLHLVLRTRASVTVRKCCFLAMQDQVFDNNKEDKAYE